jgi:hypothetical protein
VEDETAEAATARRRTEDAAKAGVDPDKLPKAHSKDRERKVAVNTGATKQKADKRRTGYTDRTACSVSVRQRAKEYAKEGFEADGGNLICAACDKVIRNTLKQTCDQHCGRCKGHKQSQHKAKLKEHNENKVKQQRMVTMLNKQLEGKQKGYTLSENELTFRVQTVRTEMLAGGSIESIDIRRPFLERYSPAGVNLTASTNLRQLIPNVRTIERSDINADYAESVNGDFALIPDGAFSGAEVEAGVARWISVGEVELLRPKETKEEKEAKGGDGEAAADGDGEIEIEMERVSFTSYVIIHRALFLSLLEACPTAEQLCANIQMELSNLLSINTPEKRRLMLALAKDRASVMAKLGRDLRAAGFNLKIDWDCWSHTFCKPGDEFLMPLSDKIVKRVRKMGNVSHVVKKVYIKHFDESLDLGSATRWYSESECKNKMLGVGWRCFESFFAELRDTRASGKLVCEKTVAKIAATIDDSLLIRKNAKS